MSTTRHSRPASGASEGLGQGDLWVVQPRPRSRHRYCGKEKDAEFGLYYYGARYYESWTCRFVSVDPLAEKAMHIQPYAYCNNNPINYIDPTGEETIDDSAKYDNISEAPPQKTYSEAMNQMFESSREEEDFSPGGNCYEVQYERVKIAYFKSHGVQLEDAYPILKTKNARDIMATNLQRAKELPNTKDLKFKEYFGLGIPGALAYAGVKGRLVFDSEIKSNGLPVGSPIQYWWNDGYNELRKGNEANGHAGIAVGNKYNSSGELIAIRFWDQETLNDTVETPMPGTIWKFGSTNEFLPFVGVKDPNIDKSVRTYFGFEEGTNPISQWSTEVKNLITDGGLKLLLIGYEIY